VVSLIQKYFLQEEAAHSKLEETVWPEGPICPHCGAQHHIGRVAGKGARIALKYCCTCRKQFRATIGTLFEGSRVPLHKWLQAIFLLYCCHRAANAHQLHLVLGLTYKSALRMVQRLTDALACDRQRTTLGLRSVAGGAHSVLRSEPLYRSGRDAMYGDVEVPWVYPYAEPNAEPSSRQFRRFAEKARELGCPEYSARFDEVLRRIIPNRSLQGIELGPRD